MPASSPTAGGIRDVLRRSIVKHDPSAAIFCELPLCRGIGRADLAAVNGVMAGYEIKSDRDNLQRLSGQVENYQSIFDHCYVVAAPRHLSRVMEVLPPTWGILAVEQGRRAIAITPVRDAERNAMADLTSVIRLLWKTEVVRVLRRLGSGTSSSTPVMRLWDELRSAPPDLVRGFVRDELKARARREADRP